MLQYFGLYCLFGVQENDSATARPIAIKKRL
jgi:hypothetical protein